jgi:hypothetical protein
MVKAGLTLVCPTLGSAPLLGWIVPTIREIEALDREGAANGFLAGITLWCAGAALADLARERKWPCVAEFDGDGSSPNTIGKLREALDNIAY